MAERIIGIDPGFGRLGYGIIEQKNGEWTHMAHGCLETDAQEPFLSRLQDIHTKITALVKKYQPARAAVEALFFAGNAKTAMQVGEARGVVLLTLSQLKIPITECTPSQIKQAITGYGRADKTQIQHMIRILLHLSSSPTPDDAADALACALTCAASLKFNNFIESK